MKNGVMSAREHGQRLVTAQHENRLVTRDDLALGDIMADPDLAAEIDELEGLAEQVRHEIQASVEVPGVHD